MQGAGAQTELAFGSLWVYMLFYKSYYYVHALRVRVREPATTGPRQL
jgi:hypothetical protein